MVAPSRQRLDLALVKAGMAESRSQAQALILAGKVKVGEETVRRSDRLVAAEPLHVVAPPAFVSRAGAKLAGALTAFGVEVAGRICADVGASTGGFTDVLLQRGAARVYAIDVGRGLLHWRLRQDPRVVLLERVNARTLEQLPEQPQLVVVDVSFIGLELVLPALCRSAPGAELVVLFKPQFQVGRREVGKGGVVRDEAAIAAALVRFRAWCQEQGLAVLGEVVSSLPGAEGNVERLLHLRAPGRRATPAESRPASVQKD
ncbi:MAG: TlyA family RNA methyltransferase [Candidatus Dormibacteraeota bacterium]|nr:TlyA family RNA methyltransferase [Candidatus Dormibacteraeota bacterium]